MMNDELLTLLARQRQAELLAEAEGARRAARASLPRLLRLRRGRLIVEVHLSADMGPQQIDQVFASLARHLG